MNKCAILLGVLLLSSISFAGVLIGDPWLARMYQDMHCRIEYTNSLMVYAQTYVYGNDPDMYNLLDDSIDDLDNADYALLNYAIAGNKKGFNSEASTARGLIRTYSHLYRSATREALQNGWVSRSMVDSDRNTAWLRYLFCLGISPPV